MGVPGSAAGGLHRLTSLQRGGSSVAPAEEQDAAADLESVGILEAHLGFVSLAALRVVDRPTTPAVRPGRGEVLQQRQSDDGPGAKGRIAVVNIIMGRVSPRVGGKTM